MGRASRSKRERREFVDQVEGENGRAVPALLAEDGRSWLDVGHVLDAVRDSRVPAGERVRSLQLLRGGLQRLEVELVRSLRAAGYSWSEVGSFYGITRQGAMRRAARLGVLPEEPDRAESP